MFSGSMFEIGFGVDLLVLLLFVHFFGDLSVEVAYFLTVLINRSFVGAIIFCSLTHN